MCGENKKNVYLPILQQKPKWNSNIRSAFYFFSQLNKKKEKKNILWALSLLTQCSTMNCYCMSYCLARTVRLDRLCIFMSKVYETHSPSHENHAKSQVGTMKKSRSEKHSFQDKKNKMFVFESRTTMSKLIVCRIISSWWTRNTAEKMTCVCVSVGGKMKWIQQVVYLFRFQSFFSFVCLLPKTLNCELKYK